MTSNSNTPFDHNGYCLFMSVKVDSFAHFVVKEEHLEQMGTSFVEGYRFGRSRSSIGKMRVHKYMQPI